MTNYIKLAIAIAIFLIVLIKEIKLHKNLWITFLTVNDDKYTSIYNYKLLGTQVASSIINCIGLVVFYLLVIR
jgi:hypothetical protein